MSHARRETHTASAGGFETLRLLTRLLDDLERERIAVSNQVNALKRSQRLTMPWGEAILADLKHAEHQAELELKRVWRCHPLASWAKAQRGVGEKSIARLIGIIGDPATRPNVAKLWAYCGVGEPTRRRRAGMNQAQLLSCGNPLARKQLYVITEAFVKVLGGPYRLVYDARREETAHRRHQRDCPRCHARAGDDWRDGHKHHDAMRIAGKIFLRDLWCAATGEPPRAITCAASSVAPPAGAIHATPPKHVTPPRAIRSSASTHRPPAGVA